MEEEIRIKLKPIFKSVFKVDVDITDDLSAEKLNNWNSLNNVFLITEIEKEFNIKFSLGELLGMDNVGDLIKTIAAHIN